MIDLEIQDGSDDPARTADYHLLYQRELERSAALRSELEIAQNQSHAFARELSHLFQHSKKQRRELASTNSQLVRYASDLRTTITELRGANQELQEAYRDTIFRLVLASEYKDKDTGNHISRMSRYCTLLARRMGLSQQEVDNISYAAPMHDVGKIGIPDSIILKNGMLSDNEFIIVKSHTTIGSVILENARGAVLQTAQVIALSHHEHWDGGGYPQGSRHATIPLPARIVALTDTFDALTSERPYKTPYPIDLSCEIIREERGKHFDPEIVDLFLTSIDDFVSIKREIDKREPVYTSTTVVLSERDRKCPVG
ncbi:MAG: HD domain-containing protein [Chitinispirillaceae bacterium]|nr:HD domain-containing protein [Chitinispirillaceae bacterium]